MAERRAPYRAAANKYGAVATEVDGRRFASRREALRYAELRMLERAGVISVLECHPRWPLLVNGQLIGHYTADFRYLDERGRLVVEDVKGGPTSRDYILRRKLMLAIHGIAIQEVR